MSAPITLRSGLVRSPAWPPYGSQAAKLKVRALLHWRQTRRWLRYLNANPLFTELVASCPQLIQKIYRPYLSNTMSCEQRLELLMTHYDFILSRGLGDLVAQAARAPVALASFRGKSDSAYQIHLHAMGRLEREGELVLQLSSGARAIYSVAFSFFRAEQHMAVGIGCVQGPKGADGLESIRAATRDLYGLRPKSLLVRLVRQLGHDYGCQDLILVSNHNRAVTTALRRGRVHADYDATWQELGAAPRANGDFQLVCEDLPAPDMEQIASKKRAEARKRHQILCCVIDALRDTLERHAPGAETVARTGTAA
jgi:uncharacterized protein